MLRNLAIAILNQTWFPLLGRQQTNFQFQTVIN